MTKLDLSIMKKSLLLTAILVGFLTASLQAGEPVAYKQVAPPPPPELYGLGFYGAIDMGANVYQNRGGDRTFTDDRVGLEDFSRTLAPGSAFTMPNLRGPRFGTP